MWQNTKKLIKMILKKRKLLLKINHNSNYWILEKNQIIFQNLILVLVIPNQFNQCNLIEKVIKDREKERKNDNKY